MELTWQTEVGDAGDYVATVSSEDRSAARAVRVTEPSGDANDTGAASARFDVTAEEVRLPESTGGPLEVVATVVNNGSVSDTQTVEMRVDGTRRDSRELSLDAGESRSLTFSWDDPGDVGDTTVVVASEDDRDVAPVQVTATGAERQTDQVETVDTPSDDGGVGGGILPSNPITGLLLFLVLAALVVVYYYVRRRQRQERGD